MKDNGENNYNFESWDKPKYIPSEEEKMLLIGLQKGCSDEIRIIRANSDSLFWASNFDAIETLNTRLPFRLFESIEKNLYYSFTELVKEDWHNYAR